MSSSRSQSHNDSSVFKIRNSKKVKKQIIVETGFFITDVVKCKESKIFGLEAVDRQNWIPIITPFAETSLALVIAGSV